MATKKTIEADQHGPGQAENVMMAVFSVAGEAMRALDQEQRARLLAALAIVYGVEDDLVAKLSP